MNEILEREELNASVVRIKVRAPLTARVCEPGQFVILRAEEGGERIPLTIADFDRENGTVSVIFQVVGAATRALSRKKAGDALASFAGPLGKKAETEGMKNVCVVAGGVGSAIAMPVARKLRAAGARVTAIAGFRSRELVILEKEFRAASDRFILMSDDGSAGEKGLVTEALEREILAGAGFDRVIAIGPLVMMKFVSLLTKKYGIPTTVSMNPVMIDGTGMCGGCRIVVDGKTVFACVEGPNFDGHLVDFDLALQKSGAWREEERRAYERDCRLFPKEEDR